MAAVTKRSSGVSLSSRTPAPEHQYDRIVDPSESTPIDYGDACVLGANGFKKAKDDDVVFGYAAYKANAGMPLTCYNCAVFGYAEEDALSMGTLVYLSTATAGGLDTTVNGNPIGIVYGEGNIFLKGGWDKTAPADGGGV